MITDFFDSNQITDVQNTTFLNRQHNQIPLQIKRDDQIDPVISGNKWRKLKHNFYQAKQGSYKGIASFGGAFSNHIAALSAAGKRANIATIGFIRTHEIDRRNPTLHLAEKNGMKLVAMSRQDYKLRHDPDFLQQLQQQFPEFLFVPEGGSNQAASLGLKELANEIEQQSQAQYIACAIGSGGTISGLMDALPAREFIGVAAVNDKPLLDKLQRQFGDRLTIITDCLFGGYGKTNDELNQFCVNFTEQTHIPIEPIYTGKLFYALCEKEYAVSKQLLAVHTGGLQGLKGLSYRRQCPQHLWQAIMSQPDV